MFLEPRSPTSEKPPVKPLAWIWERRGGLGEDEPFAWYLDGEAKGLGKGDAHLEPSARPSVQRRARPCFAALDK